MRLVKLQIEEGKNLVGFVAYWKQYYDCPNDFKYDNNNDKIEHNKDSLLELFEWKNGMPLSCKKGSSFESKIFSKLDKIIF